MDGLTTLKTEPLVGDVASFATASLALGSHSITASYVPSNGFVASTSTPLTQRVVEPLQVSSISAVSPNPRNTPVSTIDVTFSEPVGTWRLQHSALTLTDNGGSNLITAAVTLTPISARQLYRSAASPA